MYTELSTTAIPMQSSDYKTRFIAEYWQTKIRYEKLKNFCNKIEAAEVAGEIGVLGDDGPVVKEPQHDAPKWLLREQQKHMGEYLHDLEIRAIIEHIDLDMPWTSNDQ